MNRQEELLAVGGPFDGQTLSIGTRAWDVDTWKPAPLSPSLYDIARAVDPVRDVLDAGTRTRYVRTRFSICHPSEYGESHGWAWVLIPENDRPGETDGAALTEQMLEGLAVSFRGFAADWGTFAERTRTLTQEVARYMQAAAREADERIMREIVYGTQRGARLQGVVSGEPLPDENDPVLGGIMRPPPAASWQEFFDGLERDTYSEPEYVDTWSAESTADDCWRCDAARAASDIGLCDPCRDDLRDPVAA